MQGFHVAVVPIGKVGLAELEPAATRAAKALHGPIELRDPLPVPHGAEDVERGQHRAATLLERLSQEVKKLKPGRLLGGEADAKAPLRPDAFIFVTDVDLFTANTEGVIAALVGAKKCAVISVRRIREAFHNRRADPNRQRARLVKELLRMTARLSGLKQCPDPNCALARTRGVPDIDTKEERFCRRCEELLLQGIQHI